MSEHSIRCTFGFHDLKPFALSQGLELPPTMERDDLAVCARCTRVGYRGRLRGFRVNDADKLAAVAFGMVVLAYALYFFVYFTT